MKPAYYNEIDPFAADLLRQLIKASHIAPGEVDTRSIEDVLPNDLAGFVQCHFFAGIGVWSYALRRAGWPDNRPVWTGSPPCQPFSSAVKGEGFADERHLWPAYFHLIDQCRPVEIFGEQVASPDGLAWFDLVSADLENAGYTWRAVDTCAAGFGAPHIRQRLYWVAHAESRRSGPGFRHRFQAQQWRAVSTDNGPTHWLADAMLPGRPPRRAEPEDRPAPGRGGPIGLVDPEDIGYRSRKLRKQNGQESEIEECGKDQGLWEPISPHPGEFGGLDDSARNGWRKGRDDNGKHDRKQLDANGYAVGLADSSTIGCDETGRGVTAPWSNGPTGVGDNGRMADTVRFQMHQEQQRSTDNERKGPSDSFSGCNALGGMENTKHGRCEIGNTQRQGAGAVVSPSGPDPLDEGKRPGPTNGRWAAADWLFCRDGKWRPVEPGTFPLAHGAANRVGRLRGYGNAVNAAQAEEFIRAYMAELGRD